MTQNRSNNIKQLSDKVELEQVSKILLMYGQALAGAEVQIHSYEDSEWWIHPGLPTMDGATIFVPLYVDSYDSEEENFAWYKMAVTHQACHIEFGTFAFSFEKATDLFPNQRQRPLSTDEANPTDIERFFSLFGNRKLVSDIFAVVEDIRINYLLTQEYAGIRDSYQQIQRESLLKRLPPSSLPLREAFLEILIWMSRGSEPPVIPLSLRGSFQSAVSILQRLQSPEATVEDSAEATLRLYEIITAMPNQRLSAEQWDMTALDETEFSAADDVSNAGENGADNALEPDTELPDRSPVDVEFQDSSGDEPITLEDVKRFVKRPIDPSEVLRDHYPASGFFVADLPTGSQSQDIIADKPDEDSGKPRIATLRDILENAKAQYFLYDEWDFRAGSYLPKWCRVREVPLPGGNPTFFNDTLAHHASLTIQLRKQFEMLAPQRLKKLTKLQDGEEFDMNAMIESVVERKAGHTPNEKIYWKRIKMQREVAVVFLIDMSASTSELIKEANEGKADPNGYLNTTEGLAQRPRRRVIDVAKESLVLMVNALELIGDCYGVYGFSSSGRDNVELLVIKGIDETFSGSVERRIDSIRPFFSTRMGPAIRHAISKLETRDEKSKILFLVSDGYPQDRDYGQTSDDKEYAVHDTEMAFIEAKRKNIVPFCLTIDAAGHDFLKEMSHEINHQVILSIESLPQHLPTLYKRLTS